MLPRKWLVGGLHYMVCNYRQGGRGLRGATSSVPSVSGQDAGAWTVWSGCGGGLCATLLSDDLVRGDVEGWGPEFGGLRLALVIGLD